MDAQCPHASWELKGLGIRAKGLSADGGHSAGPTRQGSVPYTHCKSMAKARAHSFAGLVCRHQQATVQDRDCRQLHWRHTVRRARHHPGAPAPAAAVHAPAPPQSGLKLSRAGTSLPTDSLNSDAAECVSAAEALRTPHAVSEMVASVHPQVTFTYQTEAGTLKFEQGRDGRRVLLGKGSFGKVPHSALPAAAAPDAKQSCRQLSALRSAVLALRTKIAHTASEAAKATGSTNPTPISMAWHASAGVQGTLAGAAGGRQNFECR